MPNQPDLFPHDLHPDPSDPHADFEWLLCVASALQASGGLASARMQPAAPRAAVATDPDNAPAGWRQALRKLLGLPQSSGRKRPAA